MKCLFMLRWRKTGLNVFVLPLEPHLYCNWNDFYLLLLNISLVYVPRNPFTRFKRKIKQNYEGKCYWGFRRQKRILAFTWPLGLLPAFLTLLSCLSGCGNETQRHGRTLWKVGKLRSKRARSDALRALPAVKCHPGILTYLHCWKQPLVPFLLLPSPYASVRRNEWIKKSSGGVESHMTWPMSIEYLNVTTRTDTARWV